jgi:hypothetical protein
MGLRHAGSQNSTGHNLLARGLPPPRHTYTRVSTWKNFLYKLTIYNSSLLLLFYRLALWRIEWPYKVLTKALDLLNHLTRSRKSIGVITFSRQAVKHLV